ncbi:hypothetical protein AVEN_119785-1, partial [Araneus ventricosus]
MSSTPPTVVGLGGLVGGTLIPDRRVSGSKPDYTEDPP